MGRLGGDDRAVREEYQHIAKILRKRSTGVMVFLFHPFRVVYFICPWFYNHFSPSGFFTAGRICFSYMCIPAGMHLQRKVFFKKLKLESAGSVRPRISFKKKRGSTNYTIPQTI